MRNNNALLILLGIIAVFVLGVILRELRSVLLPFVLAVLLSNIFQPIVGYFKQKRIPTGLALLTVLVTFSLVLSLMAVVLYSSVGAFVQEFPKYEARVDDTFSAFFSALYEQVKAIAENLGIALQDINWQQALPFSSFTGMITSGLGSFITFLSNVVLVLLFMMFILAGSGDLAAKIEKGFTSNQALRMGAIVHNIDEQVRQYLLTKTAISAGTGTFTAILLWIIGVDFPLVWGFLAFLLNFIPNIGSIISVVFPFVLSLLQFDGLVQPLLVLILLGGTQVIMGNVLEPRLMAFSLNLSALLVLVSLIFWGWLWGIWGMVLAVPLTATIKIVFENIAPLRPLSILMSGPIGASMSIPSEKDPIPDDSHELSSHGNGEYAPEQTTA